MRRLIGWAPNSTLRVRNTNTVCMLRQRTATLSLNSICPLVLPAATSLIMLTVHSEWFAFLILMMLSSGFIRGRRSHVIRIARTLHQRLWHFSLVDRI